MIGMLIASALAGLVGTGITMAYNAQQAKEAREFAAEREDIAYSRNAAEAERARDWSEEMRGTAYQDTVKDMEAAGLNPAAMYGSFNGATGAYSSPAATAPGIASGNAASVGSNALSGVQDLIRTSFMLNRLKKEPGGEAALKQIVKAVQFNANGTKKGSSITETYGVE